MKVIGFSAGSVGREGNVDRMVKAVLEKSGHEYEFVKLTGEQVAQRREASLAISIEGDRLAVGIFDLLAEFDGISEILL